MATLRALQPFARRAQRRPDARERCELCGAAVAEQHEHVVELREHALRCACGACAVLFRDPGAGAGRFRTVPRRVVALAAPDDEASWARLELPVQLAFLVRRDDAWIAAYPSPAGPVESPLSEPAGRALETLLPGARSVEAEVEAILVHRRPGRARRALVVPVDVCYELVGLVRQTWRGFDGGDAAHAAIDALLARLDARAERR